MFNPKVANIRPLHNAAVVCVEVWNPFELTCREIDAITTLTFECGWHDGEMLIMIEIPAEQRGEAHYIYRMYDPNVRKDPV
jgi:hypothetical protein